MLRFCSSATLIFHLAERSSDLNVLLWPGLLATDLPSPPPLEPSELRPDSDIKSWLFTILRNLRLKRACHASPDPRIVEVDEQVLNKSVAINDLSRDPLYSYGSKMQKRRIREAIEMLPEHYREVIFLREFVDLCYLQIAEILNGPAGTAMERVRRARETLKGLLQKQLDLW